MLPLAAALLLAPAIAGAQQAPDQSAPVRLDTATPQPSGPNSGTHPGNIGKTGWTGGRADSHREGASDGAADQPQMATGSDLKGPPTQFPPSKTPE
jgi:hypothetical protein